MIERVWIFALFFFFYLDFKMVSPLKTLNKVSQVSINSLLCVSCGKKSNVDFQKYNLVNVTTSAGDVSLLEAKKKLTFIKPWETDSHIISQIKLKTSCVLSMPVYAFSELCACKTVLRKAEVYLLRQTCE